MISELKKVRGLSWNGRAENLKAAIVTPQDQGPSGHRRVYLTTKVAARHGATPGCSGGVGLGPHTEACRVRLEEALADERASAGPVGAGVGPIAEPAASNGGTAGASVFIIGFCCADADTKFSEWIHQWSWEHKNGEIARERGQAGRQQVK